VKEREGKGLRGGIGEGDEFGGVTNNAPK